MTTAALAPVVLGPLTGRHFHQLIGSLEAA